MENVFLHTEWWLFLHSRNTETPLVLQKKKICILQIKPDDTYTTARVPGFMHLFALFSYNLFAISNTIKA